MERSLCSSCLKETGSTYRDYHGTALSLCCHEPVITARDAAKETVRRLHLLIRTLPPRSNARLWYETPVIQEIRERRDRKRVREEARAKAEAPVSYGKWLFYLGADMARMKGAASC